MMSEETILFKCNSPKGEYKHSKNDNHKVFCCSFHADEYIKNKVLVKKISKSEENTACDWNKSMLPEGCKSENMLVMLCSGVCSNELD